MDQSPPGEERLIANPYIVGRPLTKTTAALFVGRDDIFAWFTENLIAAGQPNALLLYGRRRIGKTSTLYQLVEGERGRVLRNNPDRPCLTAYIDLQRFAGRPTDEWLRRIARDICRRVDSSDRSPAIPESTVAGETAYTAFDRCLDRIELSLSENSLLLIAIDEFEQIKAGIESGSLEPDILPFLRSQIQHRARIVFLISGARGLLDPYWNSITGLMARYELGPLSYDQTVTLIKEPLAGTMLYEEAAMDAIWHYTTGHPYLVQTICHRLVTLMNRSHRLGMIELSDVERVVRLLVDEGFAVDWLEKSVSAFPPNRSLPLMEEDWA